MDDTSAVFKIMAWFLKGDKPLFKSIMTQIADRNMHHQAVQI